MDLLSFKSCLSSGQCEVPSPRVTEAVGARKKWRQIYRIVSPWELEQNVKSIDRVINGHRPSYSEKTQTTCPRCTHAAIYVLPANNPGSDQEWFRCANCDHMWSQRRDRKEQGEPPVPKTPPESEGHGA